MASIRTAVAVLFLMYAGIISGYHAVLLTAGDPPYFVYASGPIPGGGANNITCFHFDPLTATLTPAVASAGGDRPGYLAWSLDGDYLYALNATAPEVANGGAVASFRIDHTTGALQRLNAVSSGGASGIVHLCLHPTGTGVTTNAPSDIVTWLFVTHYSANGEVSSIPVRRDGTLGPKVDTKAAGSNAHMVITNAAGTRLYVPCYGADHIAVYDIDIVTGVLTARPNVLLPGPDDGPRHLAFDAAETHAYVINEKSSTMTVFTHHPGTGAMVAMGNGVSTLPAGYIGTSKAAHVALSKDGRTLYGSNRRITGATSSIVAFTVHETSGALSAAVHHTDGGKVEHPRDFTIDPTGKCLLVASRGDDASTPPLPTDNQPKWLNVFTIASSGALTAMPRTTVANRPEFVGVMRKVRVLNRLVVTPATRSLSVTQSQTFSLLAIDQCGDPLPNPPAVTWTTSGGGSISSGGVFTATTTGGPFTVTASAGGQSATASVTVTANTPPTAPTPIIATPNPVTGTTVALSILGVDNGGEAALSYAWSTTGSPPASVSFSAGGNNAAKNITATFAEAGSYTLRATITDAGGLWITRDLAVTVAATPTTLTVTPALVSIMTSATQALSAIVTDQFGASLTTPPTITWTVSGGGTVNASGVFTAPTSPGSSTVTATDGVNIATATVTTVAAGVVPHSSDGGGGGGCGLGAGLAGLLSGLLLTLRMTAASGRVRRN